MRIFVDCLEMVKEVERDLFEMGIHVQSSTVQDKYVADDENYKTIELNGYSYKLMVYNKMNEMLDYMGMLKEWVSAEFNERISSQLQNPGRAYLLKKEYWGQFLHGGEFQYTYNERIREQIDYVIRELKKFPTSRQAIITIYDRHQDMRNFGGRVRIPCSLQYHFLIRDNMLHVIYSMRSCDFIKHFVSDVALAIMLNEYVAKEINVTPGYFTHFLGSLHAFYGDMKERGIF